MIAYKRKTQISCRDALQRIVVLLSGFPNHDRYLYMQLKVCNPRVTNVHCKQLFLLLGDEQLQKAFQEFQPKSHEFRVRKAKLHVKAIQHVVIRFD